MTIEHLLVGVDDKGLADDAVRAAARVADAFGARLDLVHAVPVEAGMWTRVDERRWAAAIANAEAGARKALLEHLEGVLETLPTGASLDQMLTVVARKPARALLEHATEHGADLMFLGAHRPRGLLDFGDTARQVLPQSPCPVWVQRAAPTAIERVLVAIDLSASSGPVLDLASAVARKFDARLTVLHCFTPPSLAYGAAEEFAGPTYVVDELRESEQQEFERFVVDRKLEGHVVTSFRDGEPNEQILRSEDDADLIVMGTHGRTGLARTVLGSQAYSVLKNATRPVLAVPQPERFLLAGADASPK